MSDGKGGEKVSSSSCPPSAEDLTARGDRAKRMDRRVDGTKRMDRSVDGTKRMESSGGSRGRAGVAAAPPVRLISPLKYFNANQHSSLVSPPRDVILDPPMMERIQSCASLAEDLPVGLKGKGAKRRTQRSVQGSESSSDEMTGRMRRIEELVFKSELLQIAAETELAPMIRPFFRLDMGRLGLGDDDPHGESMKLEAPIEMEGEDDDHHADSPKLEAPKLPPTRVEMEEGKVDLWRMMGPEEPELEQMEPDDTPHWMTVNRYRIHWEERWSGYYGSFEDTTRIPPMRFTEKAKAVYDFGVQRDTLQVFSVKLAATRGSLQLPLNVFGMVAVRDPIDHNRNIIFQRKRDECQTLTEKDPYLELAGPTRAVMFSDAKSNPVIIEVDLKVKGVAESEDGYLSFLVSPLTCSGMLPRIFKCGYTSKLSRLEFTLGHIVFSVEATIFMRVILGSWPDGLRGLFTASTTGYSDSTTEYSAGVGNPSIILLDSGGERSPVADDGQIKLSRHVISAEDGGRVIIQVKAFGGDNTIVEKKISFGPLKANKSIHMLNVGFCKMEITVFWSLVSY